MLLAATQDNRQLKISTPFGEDVLKLVKFEGCEGLSELFHFDLHLVSGQQDLDASKIVGENVTFLVDKESGPCRYFNGWVNCFCLEDVLEVEGETRVLYHAEVVPWLWFLTQSSDCRIFQNKSTPEILADVFSALGYSTEFDDSRLTSDYKPREYCVQYRETDFDFVSRLMEEGGIYYYFKHDNGQHKMVLADSIAGYFDLENGDVSIADQLEQGILTTDVVNWRRGKRALTSQFTATDYNYQQPSINLKNEVASRVHKLDSLKLEQFEFPGRFASPVDGRQRVDVRIEEQLAQHEWVAAEGVRSTFTPGGIFKVVSHSNGTEKNKRYALRQVRYFAGEVGSYTSGDVDSEPAEQPWYVEFEALPESVVFRPRRVTQRAIVEGPQTAVVVGPKGEEIYTDEQGRIKVQFHWDRQGSMDENSSCWVRVSQTHAGAGWGAIDIPRIGEEVIISFLEGDPDQPIVKGRVYNGAAKVPFGLPGQMTRSGGKSNTHKGSGYNEMSMDDTAGQEQMRTNAQYNMDTSVGNNQTLNVGVDRSEDIGNNDSLKVAVDKSTEVGNNSATVVGNNQNEIVGNNVVLEAGTSITLKCGASTIHMNQAGVITISGQFVSSLAAAANNIVAPMTEIVGSRMLNQAGAICLDVGGIKHIKGGQTEMSGATVSTTGGTVVIKGGPIKIGEAGAPVVAIPAPAAAGGGGAGDGASGAGADSGGAGGGGNGADGGAFMDSNGLGVVRPVDRPGGEPIAYRTGPDGTQIPVFEDAELAKKGMNGTYNVDDDGPFIVVDKNLPELTKDEVLANELSHAESDYKSDGKYDGEVTDYWEAELNSRKAEIAQIKRNRDKYPNQEEFQKRLAEEERLLESLQTGEFKNIADGLLIKSYYDQLKKWEARTGRKSKAIAWEKVKDIRQPEPKLNLPNVPVGDDESDRKLKELDHRLKNHRRESLMDKSTLEGEPNNGNLGKEPSLVTSFSSEKVKAGNLVRHPVPSTKLPPKIIISEEMDQRMNDMMKKSEQDGREYGAAIGIDSKGLSLGPEQRGREKSAITVDLSRVPPGTNPVGAFHTHPGEPSLGPSGEDLSDMRSGSSQIEIVQANKDRHLIVKTKDANYPAYGGDPAGKRLPEQSPEYIDDREHRERMNKKETTSDERRQENISYAKKRNHGYYEGQAGSREFTKSAP